MYSHDAFDPLRMPGLVADGNHRHFGACATEIVPLPAVDRVFTLDSCVRLALENSPVLREAQSAIEQAEGQRIQASLYPNPRVDDGNPQFIMGGQNSVDNVGLTQEWIRGGKRQMNMAAAQEAVRQSRLSYVRRRFELLTAVRQQFFLLLATQQRAAVTAELVTLTQHTEQTSQDLLNAGRVSETDLLLARVERRKAEASLRNLQTTLAGGRQQLAALLGLPQVAIDQVIGDLNARLPDYEDMAVRQELLATNSEAQNARVRHHAHTRAARSCSREPIPNVFWQGGYQHTQNSPNAQGVSGVYINIPIWDRNQGNIRSAGANVQQSIARVQHRAERSARPDRRRHGALSCRVAIGVELRARNSARRTAIDGARAAGIRGGPVRHLATAANAAVADRSDA